MYLKKAALTSLQGSEIILVCFSEVIKKRIGSVNITAEKPKHVTWVTWQGRENPGRPGKKKIQAGIRLAG